MNDKKNDINRRQFIKRIGMGTLSAMALISIEPLKVFADETIPSPTQMMQSETSKMTYRVNHHTNDKVSLLGFGMMRLPRAKRR